VRLRERDARLLSGRQFTGRTVDKFVKVKISRELRDAFAHRGDPIEHAEDPQILPHREPVRKIDIGALEIDPVQYVVAFARHVGAENHHAPARGRDEPHGHPDGRGLARAVSAQKPGDRARLDGKGNAGYGDRFAIVLGEFFGLNGDFGHGQRYFPAFRLAWASHPCKRGSVPAFAGLDRDPCHNSATS
jgi:hypothetical protein